MIFSLVKINTAVRNLSIFSIIAINIVPLSFDVIASGKKQPLDFEIKLGDITLMTGDIITIKENKPNFDKKKAIDKNFSKESIELAEQLTNFSKDLSENNFQADLNKYPEVKEFFIMATEISKKGGVTPDVKKNSIKKKVGDVNVQAAFAGDLAGRLVCGVYGNPKPYRGAPRNSFNVGKSNRESTLSNWGYRRPLPGLGSLGWTRARTWNSFYCGWNTFRDNAWTDERTPDLIYEQNYSGWSPNGEPNPEVYSSGPWPYADWPAYVYWWHSQY